MLKDLVLENRSRRRFFEDEPVSMAMLRELIELARLTPSASNTQPLKYILSNTREMNEKIFPCTMWAGLLKDGTPKKGERPSAYIIILNDTSIRKAIKWDDGIVAQTIMLGAVEKGLGGCMIGAIKQQQLRKSLNIPDHLEIRLMLALGKPKEQVVIEALTNNEYGYWRDAEGTHHVPKRSIEELILSVDVKI